MKIRDTYGDQSLIDLGDSLEIMAEDGRVLFTLDLKEDGTLEIHTGSIVKHAGKLLDNPLCVRATASNWVKISRDEFK